MSIGSRYSEVKKVGAGAARWEQVQRDGSRMQRGKEQVQRGGGRRREFGAAKSRCSEVWSKTTNFKVFFSQKRLFGAGAARSRCSEVQSRCSEVFGAGAAF